MKFLKIVIFLFVLILLTQSCGFIDDKPTLYNYSFSIVDVNYNNLVGNSTSLNRYNIDSMYSKSTKILDYFNVVLDNNKYIFNSQLYAEQEQNFTLKYNLSEIDTFKVKFGKNNINVYKNNQLLFNKEHISQTTELYFYIIK